MMITRAGMPGKFDRTDELRVHYPEEVPMTLPTGRCAYIWRLTRCENGVLADIITRCKRAGITALFIKCGDQGTPWKQFNAALVRRLHAAGIKVFGWSYDVPDRIPAQVKVVQAVKATGADGYLIDAEVEWDRDADADAHAAEYAAALKPLVSDSFMIFDAPWDVIAYHKAFPFTAFAGPLAARCPQVYHIAHGLSAMKSWERFTASWATYARQRPKAVRPLIPSLSTWGEVTTDDIRNLEAAAFNAGCPGVIHWVWDSIPPHIWAGFEAGTIPPWGKNVDGEPVC